MLLLRVLEKGLPAAAVFVRNSGTEDKLLLYLRGRMEFAERLNELADQCIIAFCCFRLKIKIVHWLRLSSLFYYVCQMKQKGQWNCVEWNLILFHLNGLLHEMHSRQKLIQKEGGMWSITETGRACLIYSERSE